MSRASTLAKAIGSGGITNVADSAVTYPKLSSDVQGDMNQFKNRIINGAMVIDQRNNGAEVALPGSAYTYTVDRFKCYSSASSKWKAQQVSDAPAGFSSSLKVTSLSANSPASGDEYGIFHSIEGLNVSDLAYGSASASPITVSFWVKASIAGTYPFSLYYNNGSGYQWYLTTYSIASTGTWTYVTLTVPGNTSQALLASNTFALQCVWALGNGSGSNTTSTGSWQSSLPKFNTSSSVNLLGTNGATFYITGVQLEKGSTATSFDYRPYGTELALCQRYYCQAKTGSYPGSVQAISFATSGVSCSASFPVTMRATPTVVISQGGTTNQLINVSTAGTVSQTPNQNWWSTTGISGVTGVSTPFTVGMAYGFDYTAAAEL
jgi:hypothetical protein